MKSNGNELNETLDSINPEINSTIGSIDRLSVDFFRSKSCIELSKALLGQILCRRLSPNGPILKGMIVETEAYLGTEDKACHSYGGRRTERNEPMFMSSGTAYVYFTYGMYYCFNISAEGEGTAVLLRAVQPLEGIDSMQKFRSEYRKPNNSMNTKEYKLKMLANGPSKLCIAFNINKNVNKVDTTESQLIWFESRDTIPSNRVITSERIGLSRGMAEEWFDKKLRFCIKDSEFISRK